jgi:hypothetical protein
MNGFQSFMSRFMPQQNQPQAPGVPPRVDGAKRVPKRGGWQDKAYIIGAGLQDMGGGQGNLDAAAAMFGKRDQQALMAGQLQEEDAIAREVFKGDQRGYLAWRANREETGKSLASSLEDYTLAPGAVRGRGSQQIMRAPTAPQVLSPGQQMRAEGGQLIASAPYKPEVMTRSPGEAIDVIDPNFGPPVVARSPEVGQYIKGQLADIPGLRLGSAEPRSESEIASLPLSAPNTYHRQGAALDFTAPGQNPDEVIAAVRGRMGAGYDVIYHPENGSFHVEPGPQWSPPSGSDVGPRSQTVSQATPKPGFRPATAQEKAAYGIPADQAAQISPDGRVDIVGERLKPVPIPVVQALTGNNSGLATIDRALEALQAYPGAVGMANFLPDLIRQRQDPQGVNARATIADIGSMVIHDRSGAAVTAAEFPRLAPFIPSATDSPETVRSKLLQLREKLAEDTAWLAAPYGEENGYRPLTINPPDRPAGRAPVRAAPTRTGTPPPPRRDAPAAGRAPQKPAAATASGAPKVGEVRKGYRFKGGDPANRSSWEKVQ